MLEKLHNFHFEKKRGNKFMKQIQKISYSIFDLAQPK